MIIFDEKKYAEDMLKKGFLTKHKNVYELHVLAKYYYSLGKADEQVKEEIIKFCNKHIEFFNQDEWYKIINNTLHAAQNGKFITGKQIEITQNELNTIQQLEKLNEQKVAFVMLVLYKFYDFRKFEVSIEDLYRLCKLNLNSKTKLSILQSLTRQELIDITMGSKRWVKFAEKIGNAEITITDFDDFIFEYFRYIGTDGYVGCEKCDKAIKHYKTRKYCSKCAKERQMERDREYQRKKYNSR